MGTSSNLCPVRFWDENYPDSAFLLIYNDEKYSQGYWQIEGIFRSWTKDDILETYKSDQDSRTTKVNAAVEATNDIGFDLHVFITRYQKNPESVQPIKVEYKYSENVPTGIYGYA